MSVCLRWIGTLVLAATALLVFPQQPVEAATYIAGNAADLISAVNAANNTPEADTIVLTTHVTLTAPADSHPTYGDTGLPPITSDLTIEGQGYTLARDSAAPVFRSLRVTAGKKLTLFNLTITGGSASSGGALYNEGSVTVNHVTFFANTASNQGGAAMTTGLNNSLTIINSTFANNSAANGGAVYADASNALTITASIFSGNSASGNGGAIDSLNGTMLTFAENYLTGNSAASGGGLYSNGSLTIRNSTFSQNNATGDGGGLLNLGSLVISNTTFAENSAGGNGGGLSNLGSAAVTIIHSTFAANSAGGGGGLHQAGSGLSVTNTLVAGNTGGNCLDNATISASFSLADDSTCPGFTISSTINLGTLADNGGATRTIALNSGSSALDTATKTLCSVVPVSSFDQRGAPRGLDGDHVPDSPQIGDCDVGAFEIGGFTRTVGFSLPASNPIHTANTLYSVAVTLDSTLPALYAPITAYVWVSGGTALAGVDYAPFGVQTVIFTPFEKTELVKLTLLNTQLAEERTIILSLATQQGPGFSGPVRLGIQPTHIITFKLSPADAIPQPNFYATHTPILTWNRVTGAIGYEIQVDTDRDFLPPYAYEESLYPNDRLSAEIFPPLANGVYFWRVRAISADGVGAWSIVERFEVFAP